jgi:F-type H+-transporting ATPase subunit delta
MKSSRQITRAARRLFRLCLVDGALDDARTKEIAGHIARSGRRGSPAVLKRVLRLVRLDRARHLALVESAAALPFDVQETVTAGLAGLYGPAVKPTFIVSPMLLGGMRIKVGSDVYDGSVRARLAALEARL